ncbi:MAG: 50S ribosomal protein L3 [Planctomycetota bacterium]|nr:MAG: 50S ribosomal protein L3 [Planctomycetota bacterium]
MPTAILGKKLGMTRVFDEAGNMLPVTVIEAGPCAVLQVRTPERDGYRAVQLGFDDRFTGEQWERIQKKASEGRGRLHGHLKGLTRPLLYHYLKTARGETPKRFVREVELLPDEALEPGQRVTVEVAAEWKKVDVIGTSKGRGTAGTMRAHGFGSGPRSHGSKNQRLPGSIGAATFPGRVLKGKRMYTRLGGQRATVRNLDVVKIDPEHNLILVRGGVPGPRGGYVVVRRAVACRTER